MSRTRERIRDSALQYQKGLGQNFIYDTDLLEELAELSGVTEEDDVLEIGAGSGTLTRVLCARARRVLSMELDGRLLPLIRAGTEGFGNLELVQGDVMAADLKAVTSSLRPPFSVVANLPYYITTPVLLRFLTEELPLKRLAVMVQKEAADRILSGPGEEGWGMLPLQRALRCRCEQMRPVPRECFTPVPGVDSAFITLTFLDRPMVTPLSMEDFQRVAAAGFALRRKTMANALMAAFRLKKEEAVEWMRRAGLDEKARGEKLTLEELKRLSDLWTEGVIHDGSGKV